jgi:outer membrane protein assembly factor BamB
VVCKDRFIMLTLSSPSYVVDLFVIFRIHWYRLSRYLLLVVIVCAGASTLFAAKDAMVAEPTPMAMFRHDLDHSGMYADSGSGVYGGVLWHKQTGGAVRSSPTIVGDTVLIGSSDGNLYALDADTGREKWKFGADSAVTSSPAIASGRVFFSSHKGTFYAVRFADGKLIWKTQFGPDAPRAYEHEIGEHPVAHDFDFFLSSAAILNDTVVVGGGDGLIYAFNAKSGTSLWKFRTEGRVRSSPAISNGVVYAGSYDGSLYAIDFNTGKQIWRYDTKGRSLNSAQFGFDRKSILSSPAVFSGVVYVGSRDAHLYAVDATKGTLKWIVDYEDEGMPWAISSPAVRGQVVYAGTAFGGFIHALQVADGKELWRFTMPSLVWSSPAVTDSELYITNESGGLYAVDLASGKESWHFQTISSVQSSPAVAKGIVYFGSNDGGVYAIRADGARPMQRAVYWDAETAKIFEAFKKSSIGPDYKEFSKIRDFFHERGYEVLVSATVGEWLTKRIAEGAPSVIVFPSDTLPAAICGSDPAHSLFRQYLDSGGKVVWVGFPPMVFKLIVEKGEMTDAFIRLDDASKLLDVSFKGALNGEMNNNQVTPAGRDWGLAEWWIGWWDMPISPGMTVLSLNERGFAGAWVKNYGGLPGTGFVYIGIKNWDSEMLSRLAMVAEYRPRSR